MTNAEQQIYFSFSLNVEDLDHPYSSVPYGPSRGLNNGMSSPREVNTRCNTRLAQRVEAIFSEMAILSIPRASVSAEIPNTSTFGGTISGRLFLAVA